MLVTSVLCRFPSSVKPSKLNKFEVTSARGSLMVGKLSPPQTDSAAQPQNEIDLVNWFIHLLDVLYLTRYICPKSTFLLFTRQQNLSAKLYSALRMLRTLLVKEAGEGVMAYHIFGWVQRIFIFVFEIISNFWQDKGKENILESSWVI